MGELEQSDHLRTSETIRTLALDGILNQTRRAEHYGYTQTMAVFAAMPRRFPMATIGLRNRSRSAFAVRDGNKARADSPERVKE